MEMVNIQMPIPKDILLAARIKEKFAPFELKKELAIHLFKEKILTFGKACTLADMSNWDFLELLGKRRIPLHYGVDEYDEDIRYKGDR